jgi:Domain of unknown function (DUF397)
MERLDIPEGLRFRKSQLSTANGGGCVEVASDGEHFYVRNSREPAGAVNKFTRFEWECFMDGARKGEFDPETL